MEIKIQTVGKEKEIITWPYVNIPYLKCTHQSNCHFKKKQKMLIKNKRDVWLLWLIFVLCDKEFEKIQTWLIWLEQFGFSPVVLI